MGLPRTQGNSRVVKLSGGEVEVRGLSRAEALRMADHKADVQALEIDLIATATGEPVKAVTEWYGETATQDVEALVTAVMELSGMTEASGKGSSAG